MRFTLERVGPAVPTLTFLLLQVANLPSAHYQFPIFIVNGTRSEWWKYIRQTGLNPYGEHFGPNRAWFSEPQVCGHNATKSGYGVDTAVVLAGSEIGFQAIASTYKEGQLEVPHVSDPQTDFIGHYGPAQLYLSKAPSTLEEYEGDGEWFKVGLTGSSDGKNWDANNKHELNFTIPATTPPGKYLARLEHFYIQVRYNETQQYINCAHIEVLGPGGGTPGPMVKFPGAYSLVEPGVWLPTEMTEDEMKSFPGAGPSIWRG